MSELGEKMIAYRAKHNMTQRELATMCNVSELTVINAERGKRTTNLTRGKIELIVDAEKDDEAVVETVTEDEESVEDDTGECD